MPGRGVSSDSDMNHNSLLAPGLTRALGLKLLLYVKHVGKALFDPNELLFQASFNLFKETDYKYK